MFESMLAPRVHLTPTTRFSCFDFLVTPMTKMYVYLDLVSSYTSDIVEAAVDRREWCTRIYDINKVYDALVVQICDFELIDWEPVLRGDHCASSFIVRKGMSRKAQFALQLKKYMCKHPDSILRSAVPLTLIVDTWGAFEDMKIDFGNGLSTTFDSLGAGSIIQQSSLRQRLEWCMDDTKEEMLREGREDWTWILKPSVTNKGADITVLQSWEDLLDALENSSDIREWVLQRYVATPMTIMGHKFHIRVYVLCVGALKVYVYRDMLVLVAAHRYTSEDLTDSLAHLSNTARAAEDVNFEEEKFVQRVDDLPAILLREADNDVADMTEALRITQSIRNDIYTITSELYAAYENEYTVFSPMDNCFELFGLDFMVDASYGTHLLEVNPGPDFKQTGDRLRGVISSLWEDTCTIVLDGKDEENFPRRNDFKKVYDKMWSAAAMKGGGMTLK